MLLAVTAFPGLQRLLVLVLAERIHGIESLGRLANDLSIVSLLGFFTAVGWSTIILSRIPAVPESQCHQVAFGVSAWGFTAMIFGAVILTGLFWAGLVFHPVEAAAILFGWSSYQLVRHFMLARQSYRRLFVIETSITLGALAILLGLSDSTAAYRAISVPFLLAGLLGFASGWRSLSKSGRKNNVLFALADLRTGLEYSATNILTGGTVLLLTPAAVFLAGDAYGGIIGLMLGMLSVMILIPRAMGFSNLPAVSGALGKSDLAGALSLHRTFKHQILVLSFLMACMLVFSGLLLGNEYYQQIYTTDGSKAAFISLIVYFVISQAMLPDANLLVALQKSAIQFRIALASFLLFLATVLILVGIGLRGPNAVILILAALIVSAALRGLWTAKAVRAGIAIRHNEI